MIKISVIIPTYNSSKYLPEAINSVLSQTYKDFELIIIDDGSTDNTKDLVEKYLELPVNIKYIYQQNKGPSAARNSGIKKTQGEFIAFLDADDIWLPNKLEEQLKAIMKSLSIGIVSCRGFIIDEKGEIQGEFKKNMHLEPNEVSKNLLIKNVVGGGQSVFIRKECFDKVGCFDESMKVTEDRDMWFRIAKFYDVIILEKPLLKYRLHKTNIHKNIVYLKRGMRKFIEKHTDSYTWIQKQRALGYMYLDVAREYVEMGNWRCALINVLISIAVFPLKLFKEDDKYLILIKLLILKGISFARRK